MLPLCVSGMVRAGSEVCDGWESAAEWFEWRRAEGNGEGEGGCGWCCAGEGWCWGEVWSEGGSAVAAERVARGLMRLLFGRLLCWARGHDSSWTVVMRDRPYSEPFTKCRRCHARIPVPLS